MATIVKAKPDETPDSVIRRFKKKVLQNQVLTEVRRREYYMKPSEERKERKKGIERRRYARMKGGMD
ncbi:MAG: 30S ribosomal protein S21 [Candidatus Chisholmbacteria bacterium RIFCSPLOWO2_01_FULL_50_28]|uniref:Small ribosomal subunit protein bS21 n=1 Tax=Candidatus Chisholmbacteria bacterium RIFCSPHIGHO2_01_FULL_52_32 TaxID=1797591 RepID=A0A1G1VS67_9BACT|nr:MAG: 30S ribosomal protein S21 [Candidatus Chisholmbacteria bacterium RIFCSPHIGHO2_01_FULL_52_32]OGY20376.1 MAG: 30S ribosomal protein S21 [Candidatus Chisholmbacteria bacterium RIFCSPLOWO2_01_FULL_50_28]